MAKLNCGAKWGVSKGLGVLTGVQLHFTSEERRVGGHMNETAERLLKHLENNQH